MLEIVYSQRLSFFAVLLSLLSTAFSLSACDSVATSRGETIKKAMREINYADGISKQEAQTIANAYLILYGNYKGRASFARILDSEGGWMGKVYVAKSLATPVDANLPPLLINKSTGQISWAYGPALDKIDIESLDKTETRVAIE